MATIGHNKAVVVLTSFRFQRFFAWFFRMLVQLLSQVGFWNKVLVFFIGWSVISLMTIAIGLLSPVLKTAYSENG